jgi:hypothetical protein
MPAPRDRCGPRRLPGNVVRFVRRAVVEVAFHRFIFRRGHMRGLTHFETAPDHLDTYRT